MHSQTKSMKKERPSKILVHIEQESNTSKK